MPRWKLVWLVWNGSSRKGKLNKRGEKRGKSSLFLLLPPGLQPPVPLTPILPGLSLKVFRHREHSEGIILFSGSHSSSPSSSSHSSLMRVLRLEGAGRGVWFQNGMKDSSKRGGIRCYRPSFAIRLPDASFS